MRKPRGHIRPHGFGYEVAVSAGLDPITKRYHYLYEHVPAMEEAEAAKERMVVEVTAGREPRTKATAVMAKGPPNS
jgi:integrase